MVWYGNISTKCQNNITAHHSAIFVKMSQHHNIQQQQQQQVKIQLQVVNQPSLSPLPLSITCTQTPDRDIRIPVVGDRTQAEYSKGEQVIQLKQDIAQRLTLALDQFDLLYHGTFLEENKSLQDYNVKSGEIIYIIKRDIPTNETSADDPEIDTDCEALMRLYKITGLPDSRLAFCTAIKPYIEQDSMKELIESTPALVNDPIGISFLNEPELIYWLQEEETFKNIKSKHPGVIQVIMKRLSTLKQHEIGVYVDDSDIDVYGDDDDDEEPNSSAPIITAEQLSAALALAGVAPGSSGSTPGSSSNLAGESAMPGVRDFLGSILGSETPSRSGSAAASASNRRIITSDMFSNALSQAITSATAGNSNDSSSSDQPMTSGLNSAESPSVSESNSPGSNYNEQLAKMREMGLVNDRLNLRALIISSGDVNVAINLVLSGAIED